MVKASFREDDDQVDLHVNADDPELLSDPGSPSESEGEDDPEVALRSSQESQNNNATCIQDREASQGSDDHGEMPSQGDRGRSGSPKPSMSSGLSSVQQTELINNTIAMTMRQLMEQARLRMEGEVLQQERARFSGGKKAKDNSNGTPIKEAQSELTIYKNAVKNGMNKRTSTSLEGPIDTSDELLELSPDARGDTVQTDRMNEAVEFNRLLSIAGNQRTPPCSAVNEGGRNQHRDEENHKASSEVAECTPADRAAQLIREAELLKARVLDLPGKHSSTFNRELKNVTTELLHSVVVDDKYSAVGKHIDAATRQKIEQGEYVDFAKLIP